MVPLKLTVMMTNLNVTKSIVDAATQKIEQNIAWKSSASANDIRDWFENRVNPSTATESTPTTTDQPSTVTSTSTVSTSTTTTTTMTDVPGSASKLGYASGIFSIVLIVIFGFMKF